MKGWKWDNQHLTILGGYVAGFAFAVGPLLAGQKLSATSIVGDVLLLGFGVWGFLKTPPKDAGEAFAEGESTAKDAETKVP